MQKNEQENEKTHLERYLHQGKSAHADLRLGEMNDAALGFVAVEDRWLGYVLHARVGGPEGLLPCPSVLGRARPVDVGDTRAKPCRHRIQDVANSRVRRRGGRVDTRNLCHPAGGLQVHVERRLAPRQGGNERNSGRNE